MAGHGAKKAAARVKHTLALYLTIAVLANAAYFGVRLLAWGQRLTKGEWTGALFLEGLYALALFVMVQRAEADVPVESALDLFALTVVVQLGSLYSPWAWQLLWLIAVSAAYTFGRPFLAFIGSQRAEMAADAATSLAQSKETEDAKKKRERRQEHKNARLWKQS